MAALEAQAIGPWKITACTTPAGSFSESDVTRLETQTFLYVRFLDDKTFQMASYAGGSDTINQDGTWLIDENGTLVVTLTASGTDMRVDSLADSMTLASDSGSSKLEITKITEDDFAARRAAVDATSPAIYLGDTIERDGYTFQLTSAQLVDEIYPPDTSDYYHYYEDMGDSKYYLVRGTFKNTGSDFADVRFGTNVSFTFNDEYNVEGVVEAAYADGNDFYAYQPNPLETVELYIYCVVSNEMADQIGSAKMTWKFGSQLNQYFSESNLAATYTLYV